jgi:hypothetical protein
MLDTGHPKAMFCQVFSKVGVGGIITTFVLPISVAENYQLVIWQHSGSIWQVKCHRDAAASGRIKIVNSVQPGLVFSGNTTRKINPQKSIIFQSGRLLFDFDDAAISLISSAHVIRTFFTFSFHTIRLSLPTDSIKRTTGKTVLFFNDAK